MICDDFCWFPAASWCAAVIMSLFILLVLNTGYHREALKSLKACAQSSIWIHAGSWINWAHPDSHDSFLDIPRPDSLPSFFSLVHSIWLGPGLVHTQHISRLPLSLRQCCTAATRMASGATRVHRGSGALNGKLESAAVSSDHSFDSNLIGISCF